MGTYTRKQPPLPVRYGFAVMMYGVFFPMFWIFHKLGRTDKMLRSMRARQMKDRQKQDTFKHYVPGKQDVIVATFPKSGTNWMMQIAHQLIYDGKAEFDHIHCVVPWPDPMAPFMRGYAIPLDQADHWKTSPGQKRVIKTHGRWEDIPHSDEARYIIVIRDPKDVFVSMYHFAKEIVFGRAMLKVETMVNLFLSDGFMGSTWTESTVGYWAQRNQPNVLIVSFKNMKRDLRGTVIGVAKFLELDVSDEVIDRVCELASFEHMKRNDEKFRAWQVGPWRPEPSMVRKGKQGGSSELLSPEQQRQLDEHFMAELKRLNCNFPYQEFCDVATPVRLSASQA
jgi:Sulfotransferase domain